MKYSEMDGFQHTFAKWLRERSTDQSLIACRSKMTMFEMAKCLEVSILKSIPLEEVLTKMSEFKQTSAHRIYKRDFSFA